MKINVDILMLVLFVKLFSLPQLRVWRCDTLWHFVTAGDRWRMVWRQQNSQRLPSDTSMAPGLRSPSQPTAHCFPKIFSFQIFFVPRTGSAAGCSTFKYLEYLPALADRLVIWAVLTFAIICPFYNRDIWHWIWNQNYLVLCRSGCCRLWVWEPRRCSQWLEIWIDQLECLPFTGQELDSRHLFLTIFVLESWGGLGHPDTTELQGAKLVLSICLNCLGNVGKTTLPVNAKNFHSLIFLNSKQEIDSLILVNIIFLSSSQCQNRFFKSKENYHWQYSAL